MAVPSLFMILSCLFIPQIYRFLAGREDGEEIRLTLLLNAADCIELAMSRTSLHDQVRETNRQPPILHVACVVRVYFNTECLWQFKIYCCWNECCTVISFLQYGETMYYLNLNLVAVLFLSCCTRSLEGRNRRSIE